MAEHTALESKTANPNTEENVYTDVYRVLLGGMILSSALFGIGIVRVLLHPAVTPLTPNWVQQQYHWCTLSKGIMELQPPSLMLVATALLILTPVARVLVSIYAFAVDRDRKYTIITAIVFLIMVLTVVLGSLGLE